MSAVTVLECAKERRRQGGLLLSVVDQKGALNGADFQRIGLPMFGGCVSCEASIAAYNAYPTTTGYLMCKDCVCDEVGFETTDAFEAWCEAEDERESEEWPDAAEDEACPGCDGLGRPLNKGENYEGLSKCKNCRGWLIE